jgi:hypothetical protein
MAMSDLWKACYEMEVKIVNGKEHVMCVEEAARRLAGLGLRVGDMPEALAVPYEIDFPFAVGAADSRRENIIEVRGTHAAIRALQLAVN